MLRKKKQTCGKQPPLIGIKGVISRGGKKSDPKEKCLGNNDKLLGVTFSLVERIREFLDTAGYL